MVYINKNELLENCKRVATKDILVGGEHKDFEYWYKVGIEIFITPAVNWVATECKIIIDGMAYDGFVMIHKDGRVHPILADSYYEIYG